MVKKESRKYAKKRLLMLLKAELAEPRKAHSVLETEARHKKTYANAEEVRCKEVLRH